MRLQASSSFISNNIFKLQTFLYTSKDYRAHTRKSQTQLQQTASIAPSMLLQGGNSKRLLNNMNRDSSNRDCSTNSTPPQSKSIHNNHQHQNESPDERRHHRAADLLAESVEPQADRDPVRLLVPSVGQLDYGRSGRACCSCQSNHNLRYQSCSFSQAETC